jgi:CHAD domain-containing protein
MAETVRRNLATAAVSDVASTARLPLAPSKSAGAGLQIMLAASLRNLRGASHRGESERPENVHRFRVGLRRLRSLISAFRSMLPDAERRALGARLSALGRRYSRVREWDVFLSGTLRPMAAALADEPALLELEACAREARQRALPDAIDFRTEVAEIVDTVDAAGWLHRPRPEFAAEWNKDLKYFAGEVIAKHHSRLRKRLKKVDLDHQESFHDLRIETKKLRYPIEMFEDLFEKEAVSDYLDRLIAVQDSLGQLNDALVARSLIAELPLSSRPQGLALGWLAHEIETRRQRFPPTAKRLAKAEPFWEEAEEEE